MEIVIDTMRPDDWAAVAAIYAEGMATGNATFETDDFDASAVIMDFFFGEGQ